MTTTTDDDNDSRNVEKQLEDRMALSKRSRGMDRCVYRCMRETLFTVHAFSDLRQKHERRKGVWIAFLKGTGVFTFIAFISFVGMPV